nr:extracellular ribonuclease le [Quercus suber]
MQVSWPTLACPSSSGSSFWSHEWKKHGTCSESILNQHGYFQAALNHKDKVDLLQILESAGKKLLQGSTQTFDASGNSQLYQIYLCLALPDASGIHPDS